MLRVPWLPGLGYDALAIGTQRPAVSDIVWACGGSIAYLLNSNYRRPCDDEAWWHAAKNRPTHQKWDAFASTIAAELEVGHMKRKYPLAATLVAIAISATLAGIASLALSNAEVEELAAKSHAEAVVAQLPQDRREPGGAATPSQRTSQRQVQSRLDPEVFNALSERTYYISRMQVRPKGDALDYVQPLRRRSREGDALASFKIYLAVADCRTKLSGAANKGAAAGMTEAQHLTQLLAADECIALANDQYVMTSNWLSLAAEQGSIEARLFYSLDVNSVLGSSRQRLADPEATIAWKEKAVAYLHEVAGTGNVDAMAALSNAYEQGILVPKDSEVSYAYTLATNRMMPDENREYLMRSMEQGLSIKQRESAVALSHQIYDSCCKP
ncbi:transposase family protein [Stenotrophomonas rhizophila]|uniref:transposase family protein n=1 Tax=Stenotrophomonas rhizophila TaxID=216778 RepID=UPI00119FF428|nr:transposase family protein [Stenotrophomonas rhizophila]